MAFERLGSEGAWGEKIKQTRLATYRLPITMFHVRGFEDPYRNWNVLSGLQQFQAYRNSEKGSRASMEAKLDVLDEIFSASEDLSYLSAVIEIQTGTEGVIKSFLESFSWMEWGIRPALGVFTENIQTVPHVSLYLITRDNSAKVVSKRDVEYKGKNTEVFEDPFGRGQSRFTLWGRNPDNDYKTYNFELTNITPVVGKQELELTGYAIYADYKWNQEKDGKREYYIFNLAADGTVETKVEQRAHLTEEEKLKGRYERLVVVQEMIKENPEMRSKLIKLLLPYCDMPPVGRQTYVVNDDEAERLARLNK